MAWIDPRAEEYLRWRFTRADAYRLAPPGSPEAKMPGWIDPSATRVRAKEAAEDEARARAAAEQDEFERELLALRHDFAKLKLEYELRRFQQKYSPNQPRVSAGNPDGGQWTSGGGVATRTRLADAQHQIAAPTGLILSDAGPDPVRPDAQYAQTRIAIDASALTGISRVDETTRALAEKLAGRPIRSQRDLGPCTARWCTRLSS